MRRCFLFSQRPEDDWSARKKGSFWLWNFFMLALSMVGISLGSLFLAVGTYPIRLTGGYWETPLLLVLNTLPVVALELLFYGIIGRASGAFGVTAGVVLGFSIGNYFKIMFRDDPLLLTDMLLLREAGDMAGKYQLHLTFRLALALLAAILGVVILIFTVRGRPRRRPRLIVLLAALVLMAAMTPALLSSRVYNKTADYDYLESEWSSTQQYIAHGFVYPFLHSISDIIGQAPEGYNKTEAAAMLSEYEDADIPEDQKVNIIGVQLEAYNDFTKFGVPELASDVYAVWHQLEDEGYSGNLVTNIFAGGTVDTERCFLTGSSQLYEYRTYTNSYVWYFRNQGYTVEGLHPSNNWFYNRLNVNEYLGFSDYYFMANYFSDLTEWNTAGDDIFFSSLLEKYREATASGTPYFNFSVTYQGHGPYSGTDFYWGSPSNYVVNDGTYTEEEYLILCNYFASIADTNTQLATLTDYLREDDNPVILVIFGDHNPWKGDGTYIDELLGSDLDQSTREGFLNYYATRYHLGKRRCQSCSGQRLPGRGTGHQPRVPDGRAVLPVRLGRTRLYAGYLRRHGRGPGGALVRTLYHR